MTTLVDAPLFEPLRIGAIRLASVRARCRERGLREGAHASCAARSPHFLLLELASGVDVLLERCDAALIEAEPLDRESAPALPRPARSKAARLCA